MDRKQIIMNFSVPPSIEDLQVIATEALELLPEELVEFCEEVTVEIEEFPDEATESELDLDDPYDLLALYRSGKQISPGVERRTADSDDVLILYRRPILDLWCETGEDLNTTVRQVMIEEIGRTFEFSDSEIEEMIRRHFQGLL
ncbi:MAG: metallopeptidase family protein [Alphaproteobacteria bacterium]|nr:metallopeptidase family protein [Alphaproteobacteria bacterium]